MHPGEVIPSGRSYLIHGDCMTCSEMCGNGSTTSLATATTLLLRSMIPPGRPGLLIDLIATAEIVGCGKLAIPWEPSLFD